jgi:hypothetical protein
MKTLMAFYVLFPFDVFDFHFALHHFCLLYFLFFPSHSWHVHLSSLYLRPPYLSLAPHVSHLHLNLYRLLMPLSFVLTSIFMYMLTLLVMYVYNQPSSLLHAFFTLLYICNCTFSCLIFWFSRVRVFTLFHVKKMSFLLSYRFLLICFLIFCFCRFCIHNTFFEFLTTILPTLILMFHALRFTLYAPPPHASHYYN